LVSLISILNLLSHIKISFQPTIPTSNFPFSPKSIIAGKLSNSDILSIEISGKLACESVGFSELSFDTQLSCDHCVSDDITTDFHPSAVGAPASGDTSTTGPGCCFVDADVSIANVSGKSEDEASSQFQELSSSEAHSVPLQLQEPSSD
jgi:hypothetical protein